MVGGADTNNGGKFLKSLFENLLFFAIFAVMTFINPIELMDLQNYSPAEINNIVIKKAKSRLFAEIDLSDEDGIDYKGTLVTRQECEEVIDKLESKVVLEYYYYLTNNQPLNNFLANGTEDIFNIFTQDSIYNDIEFINFINPLYAQRLSKMLSKAFQNNNLDNLLLALKGIRLVPISYHSILFNGINQEIDIRIENLNNISENIQDDISIYNKHKITDVINIVKSAFPIEIINALPTNYFQSKVSKIGSAINKLGSTIWERFFEASIPLSLLEYLFKLNLDSAGKPIFEKNYEFIRLKFQEAQEKEKNAPILQKWNEIYNKLKSLKIDIEENRGNRNEIFNTVKSLVTIKELNSLGNYANEIRTNIAYAVRALSISSWNKLNDIGHALKYITLSLEIKVDDDVTSTLKQDHAELLEMQKKYGHLLKCFFCEKNDPNPQNEYSVTIYKETGRAIFPKRSVQFSYKEVSIPRCNKCNTLHSSINDFSRFLVIVGLIVGVVFGAVTEENHFIIGGIVGSIIGFIIGKVIESNKVTDKGIKSISETTIRSYPEIAEHIKKGWTTSKPNA